MVNALSPAERKLTLIGRLSIRHDRILIRAVKLLQKINASILDIDEDQRRIAFVLDILNLQPNVDELRNIVNEYCTSYSIEVNGLIRLRKIDQGKFLRLVKNVFKTTINDGSRIIALHKHNNYWMIMIHPKKKVIKATMLKKKLNILELPYVSPSHYVFTDIDEIISKVESIKEDFKLLENNILHVMNALSTENI